MICGVAGSSAALPLYLFPLLTPLAAQYFPPASLNDDEHHTREAQALARAVSVRLVQRVLCYRNRSSLGDQCSRHGQNRAGLYESSVP
jgi:hypothetical protein